LRDRRLIAVGVAPRFIDRAESGRRIVRIHEGARSKIDGLSRKRRVVGVHDAMDETDMHPTRGQRSLALCDALKQRQNGPFRGSGLGEMTIDYVASEAFNGFPVAARSEILKGPDADVTRCDAGEYGPRQRTIAENTFAG
jgi:hypothetical protein